MDIAFFGSIGIMFGPLLQFFEGSMSDGFTRNIHSSACGGVPKAHQCGVGSIHSCIRLYTAYAVVVGGGSMALFRPTQAAAAATGLNSMQLGSMFPRHSSPKGFGRKQQAHMEAIGCQMRDP